MLDHVAMATDSKCDGVIYKIPQNNRKLFYSKKNCIWEYKGWTLKQYQFWKFQIFLIFSYRATLMIRHTRVTTRKRK